MTVAAAVSARTSASERVARAHGANVVHFDHAHRGDHQDTRERRERDLRNERPAEEDDRDEDDRVHDCRDSGSRAGTHVHRGACDRAGRGHATEQGRCEVGQALTEQLAVGIVPNGVGHSVGDPCGKERLQGREQRDGERRGEQGAHAVEQIPPGTTEAAASSEGSRSARRRDRRPWRRSSPPRHASSDAGNDRCSARRGDHDQGDEAHDQHRREIPAVERATDRLRGDERGALASRLRDAQCRRHLLQEDDHRDADREALDHRPGHVREIAAEPGERRDDDQDAGHDADEKHPVAAVASHDRNEDDRHRARRPRYLHVRATEDRRDDPRDDRGDQAGSGTQSRGDSERERERQRHDADGDAGEHIAAPRPGQGCVVGAAREQTRERSEARLHASPGARRRSASNSWDSARELISTRFAEASNCTSSGSRIA